MNHIVVQQLRELFSNGPSQKKIFRTDSTETNLTSILLMGENIVEFGTDDLTVNAIFIDDGKVVIIYKDQSYEGIYLFYNKTLQLTAKRCWGEEKIEIFVQF